jgi:hypothetical protein
MPRYMIERTFAVGEEQMGEVGQRSKDIATEQFPEITWEHSHVVVDDTGVVRTYCVYDAPGEDSIRRHADALGQHSVDKVTEIAGDVSPGDFPDL